MTSSPPLPVVSHRSVCPLDCPDTCSVVLDLQGDRVVALRGDPQHPMTQGFACVKMARFPERQHHPDRLLATASDRPEGLRAIEPIQWDEALDLIARRQRKPATIWGYHVLPYCYAGTMGLIERDHPIVLPRLGCQRTGSNDLCRLPEPPGNELWSSKAVPPPNGCSVQIDHPWASTSCDRTEHQFLAKEGQAQGARIAHIDPYL